MCSSYNQVTDSSLTEKQEKFEGLSQLQVVETLATPLLTDLKNLFSRETRPIQRHLNIQFQTPQDKTNAKINKQYI